ncbi:hypothetical protein S1R3Y_000008 [Vibrio phage vB_ValP_VA-RY-3]|nr:hypothetical protein S1R3Y_000008 [Vibrio phage vB_ValP_VA-RY-3]
MNAIELITKLADVKATLEAAQLSVDAGFAGNKDIYMAWGKEQGHTVADLNSAWKEAQPEKVASGATGWQAAYYDWLAEDSRTEEEAVEYLSKQSDNVKKHMSKHLNVWALCETVRRGQKVQRTAAAPKSEAKAKTGGKNTPLEEEKVEQTPTKRLVELFTKVAKGEFKTITLVRNHIKTFDTEGLESSQEEQLAKLGEFVGQKGIKVQEAADKALEIMKG